VINIVYDIPYITGLFWIWTTRTPHRKENKKWYQALWKDSILLIYAWHA